MRPKKKAKIRMEKRDRAIDIQYCWRCRCDAEMSFTFFTCLILIFDGIKFYLWLLYREEKVAAFCECAAYRYYCYWMLMSLAADMMKTSIIRKVIATFSLQRVDDHTRGAKETKKFKVNSTKYEPNRKISRLRREIGGKMDRKNGNCLFQQNGSNRTNSCVFFCSFVCDFCSNFFYYLLFKRRRRKNQQIKHSIWAHSSSFLCVIISVCLQFVDTFTFVDLFNWYGMFRCRAKRLNVDIKRSARKMLLTTI